jgi:hypothetical protein
MIALRRTKLPAGLCIVVLLAAGALASCGDGESTAAADIQFTKNQRRYALPLDRFSGKDDIVVSDYAQNLLVKPCMQKAGYQWPVPAIDVSVPSGATANSAGRRLFDIDIASQYGYRTAPSRQPNAAQTSALNSRALSAGEVKALQGCRTSAHRQLSPQPEGTELIGSLGIAAYEAAKADKGTLESASRWRSCMRPQGISDLPDAPSKMPSASLARRFGLTGDDRPTDEGSASPAEIRVATADARCRASSGYAKVMYDEEVDQQLKLVARNREALDRTRAAGLRHDRQVRSVIARYHG